MIVGRLPKKFMLNLSIERFDSDPRSIGATTGLSQKKAWTHHFASHFRALSARITEIEIMSPIGGIRKPFLGFSLGLTAKRVS